MSARAGSACLLEVAGAHLRDTVAEIADPRGFSGNECLRGTWSVRQRRRHIGLLRYRRTVLSIDRQAIIEASRV